MEMRIFKILAFVLCLSLGIWGIIFSYNRITDGFSLHEIRSSLVYDSSHDIEPLSVAQKAALHQILSQPFRYIGKGCQFYAFESEDKQAVLKFFKHKHLRPLTWLHSLPMTKKMRQKSDEKIKLREERIQNLFSSCQLAYEELSEETGVLFLHLNRTPILYQEVILIDKIGLKHRIRLDDYEYVLQKKAIHVGPTLSKLLEQHQEEELRSKIHQLAALVVLRCEKGIRDRDRSFVQNIAFCEGEERAVFVDIGQFFKDEKVKRAEETQKDLLRRLNSLRCWAAERNPALIPFVDDEIALYQQNGVEIERPIE